MWECISYQCMFFLSFVAIPFQIQALSLPNPSSAPVKSSSRVALNKHIGSPQKCIGPVHLSRDAVYSCVFTLFSAWFEMTFRLCYIQRHIAADRSVRKSNIPIVCWKIWHLLGSFYGEAYKVNQFHMMFAKILLFVNNSIRLINIFLCILCRA